MDRKKELLVRAYLVLLLFVVYALVIALKIGNISLIEGDKWREKGGQNVKWKKVEANRGNIFDTRGNLLATSLPFFDVRIDLKVCPSKKMDANLEELATKLAEFPGRKSKQNWIKELKAQRKKGNQYFLVAKDLSFAELERIKTYPILGLGRANGGVIIEPSYKRDKPYEKLASRTIGLNRDNATKIGLEGAYDQYLKGEEEQILMKKLKGDYWIPVYETDNLLRKKGDDIVSTINIKFQDILHNELEKCAKEFEATKACAVIMEVETGAIKAIANLDRMSNGSYHEIFNHAIATSTEPGSTMKLASTLAVLESGANVNTQVNLNGGKKKFHDLWMYDSDMHGKRLVDLRDVFIHSSNVGIATLANESFKSREGWVKFYDKLASYGLTQKTGIDIVGEPDPLIKHPQKDKKRWYGTTVPWMAHGYELMQTPLQVLNFYNAVANDGKLMTPYTVDRVLRNGVTVKHIKPKVQLEQLASAHLINDLQLLLKETVTEGTGGKAKTNKVSIAGKTGTTRVNYYDKEAEKKYNGSFVGYFPAENPQYSMILVLYEPKGKFYGGSVAAPAFRRVAERIVNLEHNMISSPLAHSAFNVKHNENSKGFAGDFLAVLDHMDVNVDKNSKGKWVSLNTEGQEIILEKQEISKSVVPDVRDMDIMDATYILEEIGMQVYAAGVGKVRKQSIKPGAKNEGQRIEIYLD